MPVVARRGVAGPTPVSLRCVKFERPAPDLDKIRAAWDAWERGEEQPGKTLSDLKTAGLDDLLARLALAGWTPQA